MTTNRFLKRPLSYSQLSSFEYDPEEWYSNYILRKPRGKSTAMETGSIIGDSIGTPNSLVPALNPPGIKEFELKANLGDIWLIGYADHFCPDTLELNENKTSTNTKKWTKASVKKHGQLTLYALLLFLKHNIKPEDIKMYLNFIEVVEGADMRFYLPNPPRVKRIETTRTAEEVAAYVDYIHETVAKMDAFVIHKQQLKPELAMIK